MGNFIKVDYSLRRIRPNRPTTIVGGIGAPDKLNTEKLQITFDFVSNGDTSNISNKEILEKINALIGDYLP